jgi:hypothetical protein
MPSGVGTSSWPEASRANDTGYWILHYRGFGMTPGTALVLFGAFTSIPGAAADKYPWLPVRYVASVQFDLLDKIHDVHMPVIMTHSRADTLISCSHALSLFAAANEPKRLITFDAPAEDGFGGHVDTLFEHLDDLKAALAEVLPPLPPPSPL